LKRKKEGKIFYVKNSNKVEKFDGGEEKFIKEAKNV